MPLATPGLHKVNGGYYGCSHFVFTTWAWIRQSWPDLVRRPNSHISSISKRVWKLVCPGAQEVRLMMSYIQISPHLSDIALASLSVVVWVLVGTACFHLQDLASHKTVGSLSWPMARAFLSFCAACGVVLLCALICDLLHINGSFLFIYELFYLYALICAFYILPFTAVALMSLVILHRHRVGVEGRVKLIISVFIIGVVVNFGLGLACVR
jgi:hypothetical protein